MGGGVLNAQGISAAGSMGGPKKYAPIYCGFAAYQLAHQLVRTALLVSTSLSTSSCVPVDCVFTALFTSAMFTVGEWRFHW